LGIGKYFFSPNFSTASLDDYKNEVVMSECFAKINWVRVSDENYVDNKYSRGHECIFNGSVTVQASSSPHVVTLSCSVEENVDTEEALSHHFLVIACFSFYQLQLKEDTFSI
jgi:hypothetical protein